MPTAGNGGGFIPNPRMGIHESPRITRIYTYDICGGLRGVREHGAVRVREKKGSEAERHNTPVERTVAHHERPAAGHHHGAAGQRAQAEHPQEH